MKLPERLLDYLRTLLGEGDWIDEDEANEIIRRCKAYNPWIPVSERLPEDEYSVLAWGNDGYGYKIVAAVSYNFEFNKFRILSQVTHWKPIILPDQADAGEKT